VAVARGPRAAGLESLGLARALFEAAFRAMAQVVDPAPFAVEVVVQSGHASHCRRGGAAHQRASPTARRQSACAVAARARARPPDIPGRAVVRAIPTTDWGLVPTTPLPRPGGLG